MRACVCLVSVRVHVRLSVPRRRHRRRPLPPLSLPSSSVWLCRCRRGRRCVVVVDRPPPSCAAVPCFANFGNNVRPLLRLCVWRVHAYVCHAYVPFSGSQRLACMAGWLDSCRFPWSNQRSLRPTFATISPLHLHPGPPWSARCIAILFPMAVNPPNAVQLCSICRDLTGLFVCNNEAQRYCAHGQHSTRHNARLRLK